MRLRRAPRACEAGPRRASSARWGGTVRSGAWGPASDRAGVWGGAHVSTSIQTTGRCRRRCDRRWRVFGELWRRARSLRAVNRTRISGSPAFRSGSTPNLRSRARAVNQSVATRSVEVVALPSGFLAGGRVVPERAECREGRAAKRIQRSIESRARVSTRERGPEIRNPARRRSGA